MHQHAHIRRFKMNELLITMSSWILILFLILSTFDGIYFHLWKFRLQERLDSKFEHITHTLRALLFIPTVIFIYYIGLSGVLLWASIIILAVDLMVEILDVLNERKSRATLGGLPSSEYLVHIMLTTFRVTAFSLAFAALPIQAWSLSIPVDVVTPSFSKLIVSLVLPGAISVAVLHVYLMFDPFFISRLEKWIKEKYFKPQVD